jgi:toxin ParE1/3/4
MSLPLIIRPEAEQDMQEGREWYDGQRDGLGLEFLDAVEKVLNRIEATPLLHAEVYRGVRSALVRKFPYVVYFRPLQDYVDVLAVVHARRNPMVWQSRA